MLYAFAVFSVTMLVAGLGIGSCCIYCIIKKLRVVRYNEVKMPQNGGMLGNSTVNATMPIQYKEESVDNSGIRQIPNIES